jgi:autotransporter-associated beta strand protein
MIERDINVTSNGSGTVTIGGHTGDNAVFSGDIALSRDVNLRSDATFGNAVTVSGAITGSGGITKVGFGTALFTGNNSYTGDTVVQEGTLFLDNPVLANSSAVYLTTGSLLSLDFDTLDTTDAIDALFIDGILQANGKWGGAGSIASAGADFETGLISGSGLLLVTPGTIPGDYNGDGLVNAADYVVWRDNPTVVGGGNPAGYNQWKQNFGTGSGSGSFQSQATVPEPSSFVMLLGAVLLACFGRRYVRS